MTRPPKTASAEPSVSTVLVAEEAAAGNALVPYAGGGDGLPYKKAVAIAERLYAEARRMTPIPNAWNGKTRPSHESWPYAEPYRIAFGVFRTWPTFGLADDEARYGLGVRIQSPLALKAKALHALTTYWTEEATKYGMPVSVRRISPVLAATAPHVGAPVGGLPVSKPSIGSTTAFVKRSKTKGLLGLTVAHALDQPGRKAMPGEDVYCPCPPLPDATRDTVCGSVIDIRRLTVDAMDVTVEIDNIATEEALDAALFSISNQVRKQTTMDALRRVSHSGRSRRINEPVSPRTVWDSAKKKKKKHPVAHKVRSKSSEAELHMTQVALTIDVIMPDGSCRVAKNAIEFGADSHVKVNRGDSGTLIVADKNFAALGMLIALARDAPLMDNADRAFYAISLKTIFDSLKLALA